MALNLAYDWTVTLGLVFGGCCSNAITLEQLTSHYPRAGSLITLFQFVLISLHGLPRHVTWTRYGPRFKQRRIPFTPYLVQVGLFYLVSLLNNAAFGYEIPMSVHIIFRSGGLVISMLLGWLFSKKRYNLIQIISVLVVTIGVILTTFSATPTSTPKLTVLNSDMRNYVKGIAILFLALIFGGFLGLAQDWTYSKYGRPQPSTFKSDAKSNNQPPQWQESLFYLHFLSLPMFLFLREDIEAQVRLVSNGPRTTWITPIPFPDVITTLLSTRDRTFVTLSKSQEPATMPRLAFHIPYAYFPLLLNTITQLLCSSGVHRLTTRVSSLTVTLILVVRKAVSLLVSVLCAGIIPGVGGGKARTVDIQMMWSGAVCVLVGTVMYSVGSGGKKMAIGKTDKDKKD